MKELIDSIRTSLDSSGELVEVLLNAFSLVLITLGVIVSIIRTFMARDKLSKANPPHMYFRMLFGGWLVVALEFQLAADIVGTIISPTYEHLVQLGAIAVIRTFLNYFLSKELAEEMEFVMKEEDGKTNKEKEA